MYQVTKAIHFSYAHRLIHHPGKCEHYHGHNGVAEIACEAKELNKEGMVVDFDEITKALKVWINETLDHRMILNDKDEMIGFLKEKGEPYYAIEGEPTAERIAKIIFDEAKARKLPVQKVTLWETPNSSASYSL